MPPYCRHISYAHYMLLIRTLSYTLYTLHTLCVYIQYIICIVLYFTYHIHYLMHYIHYIYTDKVDQRSNWWIHCITGNYLSRWYTYIYTYALHYIHQLYTYASCTVPFCQHILYKYTHSLLYTISTYIYV